MSRDELDRLVAKREARYRKFRSRLRETCASLKKTCEAKVARWAWASKECFSPEPFYFERGRLSRGRMLPGKPASLRSGMCEYGFDASGRVVVVRQYESRRHFTEEFFKARGDVIEGTQFDESPEKKLLQISRQVFKGGKLVRYEESGERRRTSETYRYKDGRIISSNLQEWMEHYGSYSRQFEMEYDQIGRLMAIYERGDMVLGKSGREIRYKRPQTGETVAELAGVVEQKLVELIPAAVARAGIKEPAYCLVLGYDLEGNDLLPPLLGVGLEKERAAWIRKRGQEAKGMMWNPAEFRHYARPAMELRDRDLLAACRLLNQLLSRKDSTAPAKRLLNRVAARLMDRDWTGALNAAREFVVFAVDLEGADLVRNMKEGIGLKRLSALKALGWM